MTYYSKKDYALVGFKKSNTTGKMYDAVLENRKTKKTKRIPFGSTEYQNYQDLTGLNLYPRLIHGDSNRRRLYRSRASGKVMVDYYSAGAFSLQYLW